MEHQKLLALIEVWKQTVQVQQHFNDLGLRIRNLALTLLVAVFGAAALALRERIQIVVWGTQLSLASALLLVGLVGWLAFYFIDRFWYHKLLVGFVVHGEALEGILAAELLGTLPGLTNDHFRRKSNDKFRGKVVDLVPLRLCVLGLGNSPVWTGN